MIEITESADRQLRAVLAKHPGKFFRIAIQGGGCSGFKYEFLLDEEKDDDNVCILSDPRQRAVVIDPMSMMYLEGAVLDYKKEPFSEMFVLENPNVKTTCGCGESFGV